MYEVPNFKDTSPKHDLDSSVRIDPDEVLTSEEVIVPSNGFDSSTRIWNDSHGRKFYELHRSSNGPGQEFFSKLIDGIMPTAEIRRTKVQEGQTESVVYVSHRKNLEEADNGRFFRADMLVLKRIFHDVDKNSHKNLISHTTEDSVVSKGHYVFDLEFMPVFFMCPQTHLLSGIWGRNDPFINKKFGVGGRHVQPSLIEDLGELTEKHLYEYDTPRGLETLLERLYMLREYFAGEPTEKQVRAILKSMTEEGEAGEHNTPTLKEVLYFPPQIRYRCKENGDCYIEEFLKVLRTRINRAISVTERYKGKRERSNFQG